MKMLRMIFLAVALCVAQHPAFAFQEDFKIKVFLGSSTPDLQEYVAGSVENVRKVLSEKYDVSIELRSAEQLEEDIKAQSADLIISPSVMSRKYFLQGLRDLASVVTRFSTSPNFVSGSVFLVHADSTVPFSLGAYRNRRIVTSKGFGDEGLEAIKASAVRELNVKPNSAFNNVEWVEPTAEAVLEKLENRTADLAVLPVCMLEEFALKSGADTSWLEVLDQKQTSSVACLHSTPLYPGPTAYSMPNLSPEDSKLITAALLQFPAEGAMKWDTATDFSNADLHLMALEKDAWAPLRRWSFQRIWADYWHWFAFALLVFAGICLHGAVTEFMVRKRTKELKEALRHQKELHRQAQLANLRIEKLQKISAVGQMSAILAHELRQPLNAIICYAAGIKRFASAGEELPEISEGLSEIESQAQRASSIVEKVRGYVKSKSSRTSKNDLTAIVGLAIENFQKSNYARMKVLWKRKTPCFIACDAMELELVVINVLKNAMQAQEGVKKPWASVELKEDGNGFALLEFNDGGSVLSEERFESIAQAGESTRPEGLGLGLAIIKSLVQAHSGKVILGRNPKGGLTLIVKIPIYKESKEKNDFEESADKSG